ncbi:MAG: PEP-CTERM sorting domain-containing protein [Candidatus Syntrophoarchaeum sp.]|nr:PEP-CTERM sorting domain-containing protein [Candidatus Syntrophoarchaeum sp.]
MKMIRMALVGVLLMMVVMPAVGATFTLADEVKNSVDSQPYIVIVMEQGGGPPVILKQGESYEVLSGVPVNFTAVYIWKWPGNELSDNEILDIVQSDGETINKFQQNTVTSQAFNIKNMWKVYINESTGDSTVLGEGGPLDLKWKFIPRCYLVGWTPADKVNEYYPGKVGSTFDVTAMWNKWCWGSSILTIEDIGIVPEPTTLALTVLGILGILGFVRRRREA